MKIIAKYEHTQIGQLLFNLCAAWTKFLVKHKEIYFLLMYTWGIIYELAAWILVAVFALLEKCKIKINKESYLWMICYKIGPAYWGGFSLGTIFVRDFKSANSANSHEFGHSISQMTLLGPLFIFMVAIPSITRYWIQELNPEKYNEPYDAVWFEDAATQCGKYAEWYLTKGGN